MMERGVGSERDREDREGGDRERVGERKRSESEEVEGFREKERQRGRERERIWEVRVKRALER